MNCKVIFIDLCIAFNFIMDLLYKILVSLITSADFIILDLLLE